MRCDVSFFPEIPPSSSGMFLLTAVSFLKVSSKLEGDLEKEVQGLRCALLQHAHKQTILFAGAGPRFVGGY